MSKELEALEMVKLAGVPIGEDATMPFYVTKQYLIIKTALKDNEWLNKELVKFELAFTEENEEKLKLKEILGIIKEKEIDIWLLKVCDYDNYCRIRTKCLETNVESMVDCDEPAIPLPTKEEFNLLKEVLL